MIEVEYSTNNSGGSWWLSDEDWLALEKAGWHVKWARDMPADHALSSLMDGERYMGALAHDATIKVNTPAEAIRSFEIATGQRASDEGCNCCGPPHSFYWEDESGRIHYCSGEGCEDYSC